MNPRHSSGPSHRAPEAEVATRPARTGIVAVVVASLATAGLAGAALAASSQTVLAADSFNRTVTGGWGSAQTGGAWTLNGTASRFAVDGDHGTVTLKADGAAQASYLESASAPSTELTASVGVDKLPGGSGAYVSLIVRKVSGQGQYQATTRFESSGKVSVSLVRRSAGNADTVLASGVSVMSGYTAGTRVNFRVRAVGSNPTVVQARGWAPGTPEPTTWTVSATDSGAGMQAPGSVGLYNYLSTGATNAPVVVSVEGLAATDVPDTAATPTPSPTTASPSPSPTKTTPTPTPTPTPTTASPTPTPTQTTTPAAARPSTQAGAAAIGSTSYTVPSGALVVATNGSDSNPGTLAAPLRTLAAAINAAPAGGAVVLRAGSYHESVTIPSGKALTIQSYPREAVWLDGSSAVTGWVVDGSRYRLDNWMPTFDHSPTYTPGAPDNTTPGWSFVNASYPMAAYPDQVWIDGVAQAQVGSLAAVTAGTFYLDRTNHKLYLGSNPAGKAIRSSDLQVGLTVSAAGSVVRGIGIRRYATSLPLMGTVVVTGSGSTFENVVVSDNATQGVFVGGWGTGARVTFRDCTFERNGILGLSGSYADGLVLDGVRSADNNTEHFNQAPVSGGAKIGRTRGITVRGSAFVDNLGPGLWLDESTYDSKIVSNDMLGNAGHGLSVEISAKTVIADNLVMNSGGNGMKINDVSDVQIWNNTVINSGSKSIWLVQDSRVASNTSTPGHDPRQALPDPTVTWILGPVTYRNNIVSGTGSNCLLCLEDTALKRSAETIGVTAVGDVYGRPNTSSPTWLVVWASGLTNPYVYTTVSGFRTAKGQESPGGEITGAVTTSSGAPTSAVVALEPTVAQPISSTIASLTGRTAGERQLGAWVG